MQYIHIQYCKSFRISFFMHANTRKNNFVLPLPIHMATAAKHSRPRALCTYFEWCIRALTVVLCTSYSSKMRSPRTPIVVVVVAVDYFTHAKLFKASRNTLPYTSHPPLTTRSTQIPPRTQTLLIWRKYTTNPLICSCRRKACIWHFLIPCAIPPISIQVFLSRPIRCRRLLARTNHFTNKDMSFCLKIIRWQRSSSVCMSVYIFSTGVHCYPADGWPLFAPNCIHGICKFEIL